MRYFKLVQMVECSVTLAPSFWVTFSAFYLYSIYIITFNLDHYILFTSLHSIYMKAISLKNVSQCNAMLYNAKDAEKGN